MAEQSYSASDMTVLEGLEAVRKRPGMYIGSTDSRGLQHTMWEIVDNAVDEALAGHCTRIDVYLHDDGSIEVHDNGRGIPVDVNAKSGLTGVEIAYTKLHGGGKFGGSGYAASGGLHGVGASVVNALSSKLTVQVDRDGRTHEIAFKRGKPGTFAGDTFTGKAGLRTVKGAKPTATGTRVRYWPDRLIFEKAASVDLDKTLQRARQTAFLVPGLELVVHDLRGDEPSENAFRFDGGIADFIEFVAAGEAVSDALLISGTGTYTETIDVLDETGEELVSKDVDRSMEVEVALKWVNDFDADVRSFVNIISTPSGGTHVVGFERAVSKAVRDAVESTRGVKTAKDGVSKDDVLEGLKAIVLVRIPEPQFEGQTKEILGTSAATKVVQTVVAEQLGAWLQDRKARDQVKRVLSKVALASVTREQVRQAKETRRRKNALESAANLPTKLSDCRSADLETTELYIVEGDSAGGTVKAARDAEFQALLPLRGKLLNVQKVASEKRMLDNAECAAIISAIGAGAGKTFDVSSRRYGRVVLLCDADVDGAHIRTLVLALLWKYCRELVVQGHVYAAVPPLYRTEFKGAPGKYHYTYSEDAQRKLVARHTAKGKETREVQRFKGLGEMDAEQMEMVLGDGRTMRRLTIDDATAAEEVFELLMGSQVAPRRDFIVTNALAIDRSRIDA